MSLAEGEVRTIPAQDVEAFGVCDPTLVAIGGGIEERHLLDRAR